MTIELKALNLAELPLQAESPITSLVGDAVMVSRLRELGFIRGELVRVVGRALFGEPILVELRGATVALRKREAECVRV
jgi:ferrous iron transport protein A